MTHLKFFLLIHSYFLFVFQKHRHSLNKLFIQESVFDDIVSRLEARFKKIRLGNHLDKCNDLGPMLNADDIKLLKDSIAKLPENGAKAVQFSECLTDSNANSIAPAIIKDLGLNTEFNLNEVHHTLIFLLKHKNRLYIRNLFTD